MTTSKPNLISESTAGHLMLDSMELAKILGVPKRSLNRRAKREGWAAEYVVHPGGFCHLFEVSTLPIDVQRRVLATRAGIPEELVECLPAQADPERAKRCVEGWDAAPEERRELARIRMQVVRAFEDYRRSEERGIRPFLEEYRERRIKLDVEVYERLPELTRSKLSEWTARYDNEGIAGLVNKHGAKTPKTLVPQDQQRMIEGLLAGNPALGPVAIWRTLTVTFQTRAASCSAVKRFMRLLRSENPTVWRYLESPDEYKNHYQLALGNASEKAHYFMHWAEIDSTPADVLCNDRKRYTIIGMIDVFSRKCRFLVTLRSNSWGIAALLRSVFLDWGLVENLVRDNGQDYVSKMINDACLALEINTPPVPPFTPEAKPHVERVFRTLAHGLQERLSGFIGHNVAQRKRIEARRSFAQRFGKGGQATELALSPQELQLVIDEWVESIYHQRVHSELKMSPNAKAASVAHVPRRIDDPRLLDMLLAPSGVRVVGKSGVRYEGGHYWDNELIDWVGRTILVRTDVLNAGAIFCLDPDSNRFICEARDLALGGMSVGDKIEAKKRANKRVRERAKALLHLASEIGDPVAEELEAARARTRLLNLPVGRPVNGNPFLDGAREAIEARDAELERESEEIAEQRQVAMDRAAYRLLGPPEPECSDPNVIRLPVQKRPMEMAIVEGLQFEDGMELWEYLRVQLRGRVITDDEVEWLQSVRADWIDYVSMFWESWSEAERSLLLRVAPDLADRNDIQEGL